MVERTIGSFSFFAFDALFPLCLHQNLFRKFQKETKAANDGSFISL